jgi:membrane protease YdiL (CAAX protease family)
VRGLVDGVVCTVAVGIATAAACRFSIAATLTPLVIVGATYAVLAGYAAVRLHGLGLLGPMLRPAWGDASRAFLVAMLLVGLAHGLRFVMDVRGGPALQWLMRVYLQLGDPGYVRAHAAVYGTAVILLSFAEELVWRGLVLVRIEEAWGSRRAWAMAAVLYALAHAPTAFVLRTGASGPNPFLVLAALAGGLAWGALARVTGRLVPGILSHALTDWIIAAVLPLWSLAAR